MSPSWRVKPMTDFTWLRGENERKRSQFDSSWEATDRLLMREIDHLGCREVVLEMDVRPDQIRKTDGWIRADARPGTPGLRLVLDTAQRGTLEYKTDRYTKWQDNLRAIALSLENLRALNRWGVLTGEQYVGSLLELEARPMAIKAAAPRFADADEALKFLQSEQVSGIAGAAGLSTRMLWHHLVRLHHPDTSDETALWPEILEAKRVVEKAGLL